MSFDQLIRDGVALADSLTESLQTTVAHHPFVSQSGTGGRTYGTAVNRQALVSRRGGQTRDRVGNLVRVYAKIIFLRPVSVNAMDKFVLPDGTTAPLVDLKGTFDPDTGVTYTSTVWLGETVGKAPV